MSTDFRPETLHIRSVSVPQNLNAAWDARTCPHRLFPVFRFCRVVNVMNALLTAVDCASAALMAAAAVFDGESEAATMNNIVFFLQLAALVGKGRSSRKIISNAIKLPGGRRRPERNPLQRNILNSKQFASPHNTYSRKALLVSDATPCWGKGRALHVPPSCAEGTSPSPGCSRFSEKHPHVLASFPFTLDSNFYGSYYSRRALQLWSHPSTSTPGSPLSSCLLIFSAKRGGRRVTSQSCPPHLM